MSQHSLNALHKIVQTSATMPKRIVDEEMRFSIIINGDDAQKELFDIEKSNKALINSNKKLRQERGKLERQGKKNGKEWKALTNQISANSTELKKNYARMNVLENQIGVTGLTMSQLQKRASALRIALRQMLPGSADYLAYENQLKAISTRMTQLRLNSRGASSGIGSLANGFNKYAALGASVIAGLTGVVFSLQKVIDYNGKLSDSMSDVRKTTGLTDEEVQELTKSFGILSTRTTRIELLKLAEEAGRLGIKGKENIAAFVAEANKLKVALGDDLSDEAIREVGKIVNIYKVGEATGKSFSGAMEALGSAINEVSASGANNAGFLVDYLKRQAGVAAQAKLSAADNIGYAATFDELGQSVEISATAMNKIILDMFKNPSEFAKIAGLSVKDFNRLLEKDSNQAMIAFLKGLNGTNDGLGIMSRKLEDLGVDGARGSQALLALAGNTKLLEERQAQSNVAQTEAISLTNEYDLKNNNLAATVQKVSRRLRGLFTSDTVTGGLTFLINAFGKLIGAISDADEEFKEASKTSFQNAKNFRNLANESSSLLDRYNELTQDGVEPTKEAKEELDSITLQLKDRLGDSVFAINKETGAYELNTEAVKEQIKIKRLAADEEASTLASRLKGTQEEKQKLNEAIRDAKKEFEIRKRQFQEQNKRDFDAVRTGPQNNNRRLGTSTSSIEGFDATIASREKVLKLAERLNEQKLREIDLTSKLNELNFTQEDVDKLFEVKAPGESPEADPTNTDTSTTTTSTKSKSKKLFNLQKEQEEVQKLIKENADAKASLLDDDFKRELELLEIQHQEKIRQLTLQQTSVQELKELQLKANAARGKGDTEIADNYEAQMRILMQKNTVINEQLETLELTHQQKKGTLISEGFQGRLEKSQENFERERSLIEEAQNNQLAQLGTNEEARKALQEKFNQENLEAELLHLETLKQQAQDILSSGEFEGFDLNLLTEEETQAIIDRLSQLGLSISQINSLLGAMKNGGGENAGSIGSLDGLGAGRDTDILGFSLDQWQGMYDNLDTARGKIAAVSAVVAGLQQAWAMYNEYRNASDKKTYEEFEQKNEKRKEALKRRLDNGLINQRQYDSAVQKLDKEADKRKAELEYKAAKRKYQLDLVGAIIGTAQAVLNGLNTQPFFPLGIAMGALAGVLGGIQIATITKNKPVKGFQEGLYPVTREQDGRRFNARNGGLSRTGLVSEPTVFLAGEGSRPELIINGTDYSNFTPEFKGSLSREIGRVKGYQDGFYQSQSSENTTTSQDNTTLSSDVMLMEVINRNTDVMMMIKENGVIAYLSRDMENTQKIEEDLARLQSYKNKAIINGRNPTT